VPIDFGFTRPTQLDYRSSDARHLQIPSRPHGCTIRLLNPESLLCKSERRSQQSIKGGSPE
jgi:hypothetical protein